MKQLTNADYKEIILRRDPRYDGRLYFGVTTTRIYCRPVCPARPKPENIVIFKSTSEAEKAGYRPCLRCRPDLAPGNKCINPGKNIVGRGLRLMEESGPPDQNVEAIAEKLGISTRHLRRVFKEQLGASPVEIMQTRKLHLAKQLLLETQEPVTKIAYGAGFNSIRRFNESFKAAFRRTPSEVRKGKRCKKHNNDGFTLTLMVRKPYDFSSVLAFLKRHAARGIEKINGNVYERYVPGKNMYSTINITINTKKDALLVSLRGFRLDQISSILVQIRRLFDTDHNPAHLPATSAAKQSGVRVPGSYDPFETAVSIILSQLISIQQATKKLGVLIERYGSPINDHGLYAFPRPERLMVAEIEKTGITRSKADAIRALSGMIHNQEFTFSYSSGLPKTRKQLLSIRGIGPWTTEMIMMRCFGDADAFPENDLIIQRALEQNLVDEALWKTNRSYMTHYVWNKFAQTLSKQKKL